MNKFLPVILLIYTVLGDSNTTQNVQPLALLQRTMKILNVVSEHRKQLHQPETKDVKLKWKETSQYLTQLFPTRVSALPCSSKHRIILI